MENKKKTEFHYSVQNGGDGSASLMWFTTRKLADFDQDVVVNDDYGEYFNGWAESCAGTIYLDGQNISMQKAADEIMYVESHLLMIEDPRHIKRYVDEFCNGDPNNFDKRRPDLIESLIFFYNKVLPKEDKKFVLSEENKRLKAAIRLQQNSQYGNEISKV